MVETIKVGDTVQYETVWFDGPNGTGNVVVDPGTTTFATDNPGILGVQPAAAAQTADVSGVSAGGASLSATSSTGIVAGSLDVASGQFTPGPLSFNVVAVGQQIVSGIIRAVSASTARVSAAFKR